jgi:putative transposase
MLKYLLLRLIRAALQSRSDLVAENLLLRQQLGVRDRPTRQRPRLRFRDQIFWIFVRAVRRDWRRHLVLIRPETVVRSRAVLGGLQHAYERAA